MLGKAMMLACAAEGIHIDKSQKDEKGVLTIWISVPEHSYTVDVNGNEMAGDFLAKRTKELFSDIGLKNFLLKYRVRKGEYWTKQMEKAAQEKMKKMILGSQW